MTMYGDTVTFTFDPLPNFTKFITLVQLGTEMNSLDFEVRGYRSH